MIKDKIVLITGTSRGIGKSIAELFAENNAIVYANARINHSIDQWALDLSIKYKTLVVPVYFDIRDEKNSFKCITEIFKKHKKIDILVNNAGIEFNDSTGLIDMNICREIFDTNVFALLNILQIVARLMIKNKKGSIINITSQAGITGNPGQISYSASKAAVISITQSTAKELGKYNIRVNAIAPGLTDTEMTNKTSYDLIKQRIDNSYFKTILSCSETAKLCLFLGSDQSDYINGQTITING